MHGWLNSLKLPLKPTITDTVIIIENICLKELGFSSRERILLEFKSDIICLKKSEETE